MRDFMRIPPDPYAIPLKAYGTLELKDLITRAACELARRDLAKGKADAT